MIDRLAQTSLDPPLFYIENIFYIRYKTSNLNEEVNPTNPSL
jgi:hypothetical protein